MHVIMGASGHVGSAAAKALLARGEKVLVVLHNKKYVAEWRKRGALTAIADVRDIEQLRSVFHGGKRAFLLNPPGDIAGDTDQLERETAQCILAALDGSGLEKVVVESTYGAQPGHALGDLSVLFELEEGLRAQPIPTAVLRAAFYMSNWDALAEASLSTGWLEAPYPADHLLPMVAPDDLGDVVAGLMTEPVESTGITYVEGPERYTPLDVAKAVSDASGKRVRLAVTPREHWEEAFRKQGFSAAAARSYARMTATAVDRPCLPNQPVRGTVTLGAYLRARLLPGPTRHAGALFG